MIGIDRIAAAIKRALVLVGGGGLLVAAAVEFLAVIGRHAGLPLLGSIELTQTAILILAASSIVAATAARAHAAIHLVLDRMPPKARDGFIRVNRFLAAIFFVALVAGSVWLAADMWTAHEESELLGLPYRPLRIFSIVCLSAAALLLLRQAWERNRA